MAVVPEVFTKAYDEPNISVDYVDSITGIGYRRYFLALGQDSVSVKKFLTTRGIDGNPLNVNGSAVATFDYDFDIDSTNVFTLSGIGTINFTTKVFSSSATSHYTNMVVTLYKVSASAVETQIGQITSPTHETINATDYFRDCLRIPITTTQIGRGEKLRVSILYTSAFSGVGTGTWLVYFEPNNNNAPVNTNMDTDFYIDVPFKIDL